MLEDSFEEGEIYSWCYLKEVCFFPFSLFFSIRVKKTKQSSCLGYF